MVPTSGWEMAVSSREAAVTWQPPPNMALQRTRRPRIRSGRSRCSLGSPLNAVALGRTPG